MKKKMKIDCFYDIYSGFQLSCSLSLLPEFFFFLKKKKKGVDKKIDILNEKQK